MKTEVIDTTYACGCRQVYFDPEVPGERREPCPLHQISRFACCMQAEVAPCVCYERIVCPVHGDQHRGTHD